MQRNCERCGAAFTTWPGHIKKGWGRFCSISCAKIQEWESRDKGTGYQFRRDPDHPLADAKGVVRVHRAVLFDAIGPGPHPCHWCGTILNWRTFRDSENPTAPGAITVDHLDLNHRNNAVDNLVPSCHACNVWRNPPHRPLVRDSEDFIVGKDGGRRRAVRLTCETCGQEFLRQPSNLRQSAGRFCSRPCVRRT